MTFAALFRAGRGHAARADDAVGGGVRLCGEYLASADGATGPGRRRLVAAIGALTAAHATAAEKGEGETAVFDTLLRTGQEALDSGGTAEARLALGLAEVATAARERSKGAWRLRGRALDALGRYEEAVEAYGRHLELQENARAGAEAAHRVETLRALLGCVDEAAALFPGSELDRTAFGAFVTRRIGERGAADPDVRRLAGLYSRYRRLAEQDRMPDPLLGGTEPIGVGAFRNLIAGRTVRVLADGAAEEPAGAADLVIRCDGPAAAGERADVHAVSPRGATPWDGPGWERPAGTRLVFGERLPDWRRSIRRRLVPGAQDRVGDGSLRRPVSDPALIGESEWGAEVSTGFGVVRLLRFLDVSPRVDLVGFDPPGRLRPREREWVEAHTTRTDDGEMRMSQR